MAEDYYMALYRVGDSKPLGAIRASMMNSLLVDLGLSQNHYVARAVTPEEAQQIRESLTRGSEKLEQLLAKK